MSVPNRQIGQSAEANLLWHISKQIDVLKKYASISDPALLAKIDELITATSEIEISAESINLNTDELESLSETGNQLLEDLLTLQTTISAGKPQDFVSWVAVANDTLTIPASKFSTISMLAAKGEFKIENTANDFSTDLTASSGTLSTFVEISEDGSGTSTGATNTPQGFDTRSNMADMAITNSFLVTCVRNGVLQLELYK